MLGDWPTLQGELSRALKMEEKDKEEKQDKEEDKEEEKHKEEEKDKEKVRLFLFMGKEGNLLLKVGHQTCNGLIGQSMN